MIHVPLHHPTETARPTISLSISHTPWVPERVASLVRLNSQLGEWDGPSQLMADPAPNHVWSETMWKRAVSLGSDWSLFLQDDVQVAPNFRAWVDAMLASDVRYTSGIICLESVHPAAPLLADNGSHWYSTRDGVVGVGYLLPTADLSAFLSWRATELAPGAEERVNEDTLLGLWCLVTGRHVWSPIPTPIDHDVSLKSVYGNDRHPNRRPLVRWDTVALGTDPTHPSFWRHWASDDGGPSPAAPHLGIFPMWGLPALARREVIGYTPERFATDMADTGHAEILHRLVGAERCFFCAEQLQPYNIASGLTGVSLCRRCVAEAGVRAIMGGP